MVNHQKEVYCRHGIWHLDLTHKANARWQLPLMATILMMITPDPRYGQWPLVTNLSRYGHPFAKDGHQLSPGWPNTIPKMVIHHLKVGHRPTQRRSLIITRMVITHCLQDGLLGLEFDSKAPKLVKLKNHALRSFLQMQVFQNSKDYLVITQRNNFLATKWNLSWLDMHFFISQKLKHWNLRPIIQYLFI